MRLGPTAPIGVLGAGAMGRGIAQVAATCGHPVVVADANAAALASARTGIDTALQRGVEKGRLDAATAAQVMGRIRFHQAAGPQGMQPLSDSALVIEAIVEDREVKRAAFRELEAVVTPDCVLATNTSSLSVAGIAAGCTHAERVLGVHFFNPAPVMPLVEIIPWLRTAPAVAAQTRTLMDAWGKTTVRATDTPGFIVNRVVRPFYSEALRLRDEGIADAPTIDWAMREMGKFPMGPFELMDLIGHDVNFAVTCSVFEGFYYDPRFKPSVTQQRLVEAGLLGRKTGRGIYDYGDGAVRPQPTVDRALGRRIFERILAMLINEAVEAVQWGVAPAAEIDLAVTKGVNYPKGLLAWGNEWGLDRVLAHLVELQADYGEDRYRPSALLKRMARDGTRF